MMWRGKQRWPGSYVVVLLAGLALRLYFVRWQPHVEGDSFMYGELALNMLRHHVYGVMIAGNVHATLIRLPGYPLLMAACFALFGQEHYASVLYVQVALDLATCWLLAALARRLWGARAGFCALVLATLCPFTANFAAAALTETVGLFCAALALYAMERWKTALRDRCKAGQWAGVIGLALAFGVLLRPDRALVAVAIVPMMVWVAWRSSGDRKAGMMQVALVCAVILLPLAVWTARNWRVFHVVQPLAPKSASDPGEFVSYGFQRWYRTWGIDFKSTYDIYWNYDGARLAISDVPERAFDSDAQRAETATLFERYNKIALQRPEFDHDFRVLADQRIAAHPLQYYVLLPVARVVNMWLRPRTDMLPLPLDWWRFGDHRLESAVAAAFGALNLAYLGLAAAGLWLWKREGWAGQQPLAWSMVAFVVLRSAMLLTLDNSEPRYTIDCYPVVILLAALAVSGRRPAAD